VRRKDGQYRWFLIQYHPLRDQQGAVIRWYAAGTDINDRKRAEDALRSTEESLRLTVDSIPGLVSTANAAGEVEFISRQKMNQCAAHRNGDRFSMNRCATMFTTKSAVRRQRFCATRDGAKNNRQPRCQNRRVGGLVNHIE